MTNTRYLSIKICFLYRPQSGNALSLYLVRFEPVFLLFLIKTKVTLSSTIGSKYLKKHNKSLKSKVIGGKYKNIKHVMGGKGQA